MTVTAFKPRLVATPRISPRPIPERLSERRFASGHTLRIDKAHEAKVLAVKEMLAMDERVR